MRSDMASAGFRRLVFSILVNWDPDIIARIGILMLFFPVFGRLAPRYSQNGSQDATYEHSGNL